MALELPAQATLDQAPALLRQVDSAIASAAAGAELRLDASRLTAYDSSAIALLLHARRAALARGVTLRLEGAPPKLRELARLYGVEGLLPDGGAQP